jgi:hypothetical protein
MNDAPVRDAAWVAVDTSLPAAALRAFCDDVERLLRINSMLEFLDWRSLGDGAYAMKVRNLSNGRTVATSFRVARSDDRIRLTYDTGLKTATEFRIEPSGAAARLIVTDDYSGTPEAERRARMEEIDRSLVHWGHDLRRYLRQWHRWSRWRLWRWYMRRVWQPMKPSARRITFIIIAVTVFEVIAAVVAVVIFAMGWETYFRQL